MKFGKRYSKVTVLMAMIHGVIIGIAGVALIGLLLMGMKGKEEPTAGGEEVPTSGPAAVEDPTPADGRSLRLFAKQHGVFTATDSAAQFIAEDAALAKAAIVQVNDKYYVWTAIALKENDLDVSESEGTFRKAFNANTEACGASGAGKLWEALNGKEIAEIKNLASEVNGVNEEEKSKDFVKNITAITAFTDDLRIAKLLLLSHYSSTNKCVKITF